LARARSVLSKGWPSRRGIPGCMRECQVNTHRGGTPQMGVRERVQGEFQIIWDTLRSNVEAMPESLMDFAPEGLETRSFRAIALHAANASVIFGENIGRGVWERIEAYPAERVVSKAQVLVSMREAGQRFLAGLARLADDEARRVVRAPWERNGRRACSSQGIFPTSSTTTGNWPSTCACGGSGRYSFHLQRRHRRDGLISRGGARKIGVVCADDERGPLRPLTPWSLGGLRAVRSQREARRREEIPNFSAGRPSRLCVRERCCVRAQGAARLREFGWGNILDVGDITGAYATEAAVADLAAGVGCAGHGACHLQVRCGEGGATSHMGSGSEVCVWVASSVSLLPVRSSVVSDHLIPSRGLLPSGRCCEAGRTREDVMFPGGQGILAHVSLAPANRESGRVWEGSPRGSSQRSLISSPRRSSVRVTDPGSEA
jgi:hypothetical protein